MNIFKDYYKKREETIKKLNLFFDFDDLSRDLDLFFFDNTKGESIASKYINNILESNNQFKPDLLIQAFNKDDITIIQDVIEFYFDDVIYDNGIDIKEINNGIKKSTYPPNIKRSLYTFFISPTDVCAELKKDIKLIHNQVMTLYNLKERKENVYLSSIREKISNLNLDDDTMDAYCSYSLVYKENIFRLIVKSKLIIVVGINANEYDAKPKDIELHLFGNIISDKSRIKVLEYLKDYPFSDIYAINQYVKIKNTTLVYHLNLMIQCNVLKKHTRGKEVCYEINKQYLSKIASCINIYQN